MSAGLVPPTFVGPRTLFVTKFWTCVSLLCVLPVGLTFGKIQYKVRCSNDVMKVDLVKTEDIKQIYLDQLKNYPAEDVGTSVQYSEMSGETNFRELIVLRASSANDVGNANVKLTMGTVYKECHPQVIENKATFLLSLTDIHRCGVTRISDKVRNKTMYYHRIIVEHSEHINPDKESFLVKCVVASNKMSRGLNKRNVLPAGFQEPEDLEITTSLTEKAPEPMLNVGVRQGKERITGEVNVTPGTPLTMEIYLDKSSAPIYGILVSFMQVTDTKQQEETIIFNGCSVDPYLFENFNTVDGDFLSAKFRAFKFPDSNYVQFKGTVNVCLDKCQGVQCSNGQIGYGRKRRSVPSMPADPNKIFEVSLTTFIKINFVNNTTHELKSEEILTRTNNTTEDVFILKETKKRTGLITAKTERESQPHKISEVTGESTTRSLHRTVEGLNEEFKYSVIEEAKNSASLTPTTSLLATVVFVTLNFFLE